MFEGKFQAVAFDRDGRTLASTGFGDDLQLWSVPGLKLRDSAPGRLLRRRVQSRRPHGGSGRRRRRRPHLGPGRRTRSQARRKRGLRRRVQPRRDARHLRRRRHGPPLEPEHLSERPRPRGSRAAPSRPSRSAPTDRRWPPLVPIARFGYGDLHRHSQLKQVLEQQGSVTSVAFSPDGRTVAAGGGVGSDFAIRLWDVRSHKPPAVLLGHENIVSDVAFSPDRRTLASSSWDGTIRLWDVHSHQQIDSFGGGTDKVILIAYSRGRVHACLRSRGRHHPALGPAYAAGARGGAATPGLRRLSAHALRPCFQPRWEHSRLARWTGVHGPALGRTHAEATRSTPSRPHELGGRRRIQPVGRSYPRLRELGPDRSGSGTCGATGCSTSSAATPPTSTPSHSAPTSVRSLRAATTRRSACGTCSPTRKSASRCARATTPSTTWPSAPTDGRWPRGTPTAPSFSGATSSSVTSPTSAPRFAVSSSEA